MTTSGTVEILIIHNTQENECKQLWRQKMHYYIPKYFVYRFNNQKQQKEN